MTLTDNPQFEYQPRKEKRSFSFEHYSFWRVGQYRGFGHQYTFGPVEAIPRAHLSSSSAATIPIIYFFDNHAVDVQSGLGTVPMMSDSTSRGGSVHGSPLLRDRGRAIHAWYLILSGPSVFSMAVILVFFV